MKRIDVSIYIYIFMMLLMFACGTALGQEFVSNDNFKENLAKDITVIEFWADWNKANQFNELIKLKECNKYRLDIMANMDTQSEYNVSAIPTIIIFDNGVEKERFLPNIMFQLEADKKIIQNSIDTIILNKFQ